MKHLTKSSVLAVALALVGAASVLADDSQAFHNRAAQAASPSAGSTTVAVYNGNGRNAGNRTVQEPPAPTYSLRSNGHGQLTGEYRQ